MADARCGGCKFWQALRDGDETGRGADDDGHYHVYEHGTGRCRRMPPSNSRISLPPGTDSLDAADMALWPVTWDEDWCGEFAPRLTLVVETPGAPLAA